MTEYGSDLVFSWDSVTSLDDVLVRLLFPMKKPRKIRSAAATTDPTTGPAIQARLSVPTGEGEGGLVAWNIVNIIRKLLRESSSIPDGAF